jgi:glycosyltransferase involved in cell wall biosynthesis
MLFLNNLRRLDVVVGVSDFWRSRLLELGARRVEVIHNAVSDPPVQFEQAEVGEFGHRYGFDDDIPLIYLGTSQREKGVVEAYRALSDKPYQFVVSGGGTIPELPVRRLDLARREYLLLLHRSDVAVVMSNLVEGWCRTAHEAMLCGTPVVGSGRGGMRELLDGGQQIVCASFSELPAAVACALDERAVLGQRGRRFAESFTCEQFEVRWRSLVQSLLREGGSA